MKVFGLSPNVLSPIVAPMIWRSWSRMSSIRSMGFVTQITNCADASCNPNCLLFCASLLHYLCRDQQYLVLMRTYVCANASAATSTSPYQHRLPECLALSPSGRHHRAGRGE